MKQHFLYHSLCEEQVGKLIWYHNYYYVITECVRDGDLFAIYGIKEKYYTAD